MNLITNMTKSKCTREQLLDENARVSASLRLTDADFANAAGLLGVETAAIRAVLEVGTGNKGGFLAPGKPTILFEGHVF